MSRPKVKIGDVVYVRVRITGQSQENSFLPSLPVVELDGDGNELGGSFVDPESIVTPQEIRTKLMNKEQA